MTDDRFGRDGVPDAQRLLDEIERVADVGIWEWDPAQPYAWWSPQLYKIYGLDPKQHSPSYEDYLKRVHPADRERVRSATEAVFKDCKPYSHDERIFRPDGSMRYLHTWAHALVDANGKLTRLVGVCQDITERREAELAQERLAAIVASSDDAVISKDLNGRIVSWNKSAERLFGYTAEEVLGRASDVMIPPGYEAEETQILRRIARGERVDHFETRRRRKDGTIIDVSIAISPIRDSNGVIVGSAKVARDVSERHASEERFRQLLEAIPDALVIVDQDGTIVRVNQQTERLLGYARDEMIGQPIEFLVPDSVRDRHVGYRQEYLRNPGPRPMGIGRDLKARRKDGFEVPVEISLNPLKTERGLLVLSAIRDVTERRRLERERDELDRLRAMDRFKGQFINMAAHELNTPLTPLKLQVHMLRKASLGPLTEAQQRAAEMLERNLERVEHLVRNMLDVGRIESGRIEIRKAPLDVNGTVEEAVDSFQDVAKQVGVHLEAWTAGDLWVEADVQRIHQVLFNLISNAIKFTPAGGRVLVEAQPIEGQAVLRVRDNGAGLSRDQIARLFQPFSQVHEKTQTGGQPGTGLGLFISRQLVELHGGTLTVESPGPGQGSTFTFTLPGLITKEPQGPSHPPAAAPPQTPSDIPPRASEMPSPDDAALHGGFTRGR